MIRHDQRACAAPKRCTWPRRRAERRVGAEQVLRGDAPDREHDLRLQQLDLPLQVGQAGAPLPRASGRDCPAAGTSARWRCRRCSRDRGRWRAAWHPAAARRARRRARPGGPPPHPAPRRSRASRCASVPTPNTLCVRVEVQRALGAAQHLRAQRLPARGRLGADHGRRRGRRHGRRHRRRCGRHQRGRLSGYARHPHVDADRLQVLLPSLRVASRSPRRCRACRAHRRRRRRPTHRTGAESA